MTSLETHVYNSSARLSFLMLASIIMESIRRILEVTYIIFAIIFPKSVTQS